MASVRQKGELPALHTSAGFVRTMYLMEKILFKDIKDIECNFREPCVKLTPSLT